MTTSTVVKVSAAIEAATAVGLIVVPNLVARLLLGTEFSTGGIATARVAGFALLSLAIACWPHQGDAAYAATRGLFVYNLLVALYFAYLGASGTFFTYLLWVACAVHALLGLLLARPAYTKAPAQS